MEHQHGGDIYGIPGVELDFSVSLNPLGTPFSVLQAAAEAAKATQCYPDPHCRALRRAISCRDGVGEDWVVCGNGASDLIWRLALALRPRRALVTAPTFSEYGQALSAVGCGVEEHSLHREDNFDLSAEILNQITPELDLVFLCDPNNPTGRLIPEDLLTEILSRCRRAGALLAVDQCFLELTEDIPHKLVEQLAGGGLILLRALTKSYALAGLRLGYCLCQPELARRLALAGQPWAVSLPAQAAGEIALQKYPRWPFESIPYICLERERLSSGLTQLGFWVCPSQANYLLFYGQQPGLDQALLARGLLLRDCANYSGLGPGWRRAGIQTVEKNSRLLQAMEQIIRRG